MQADVRFEWDPFKAVANWQKHEVSFEEAATAFFDEDRFVLLGLSSNFRVLVVCHCYRAASNVIRIISARRADKSERDQYGAN